MKFLSTASLMLLLCTLATTKTKKKVWRGEGNGHDIYTPPPKTKECLERELTIKIIELYTGFLNISQNLFAITREQANGFKDLVTEHEELRKPPVRPCKRKLPKFAQCKFDEVAYILRTNKCTIGDNPNTRPTTRPTEGPMADEDEVNGEEEEDVGMFQSEETEDEDEDYKRKKREVSKRAKRSIEETHSELRSGRERRQTTTRELRKGQRIVNADGSITDIRECFVKGSTSLNKHLRMAKQCSATTTLPENRFPRYINEVLCDFSGAGCLSGEGLSVQRKVNIKFRVDSNRTLGIARLGSWQEYEQTIMASCSCQIKTGSFFGPLL